jgi:putative SOS response-associated peptidase YedK
MQPIHERMPVILPPETWDTWLKDNFQDGVSLKALLKPCPEAMITAYPVSKFVNSIKNNSEQCLQKAE